MNRFVAIKFVQVLMTGHCYVTGEVITLVSEVKAFLFIYFSALLGELAEVAIAVSSVFVVAFPQHKEKTVYLIFYKNINIFKKLF